MKKLSFWAKTHKWPARILIVVSFIFLNILGIVTGLLLNDLDISISSFAMIIFCCIYITGIFLYPQKWQKRNKVKAYTFYARQKTCDFVLAASTFCMIVYIGNHPEIITQRYGYLQAATVTNLPALKDSAAKPYKTLNDFNTSMKDQNGNLLKWKERKILLKEQIKGIKKTNELSDGEKTMLVILSVLIALGLITLVGALSCNLSCSGSDAAAAIVGIGGTALIIFLLVVAIRAIYGKNKKKKKSVEKAALNN